MQNKRFLIGQNVSGVWGDLAHQYTADYMKISATAGCLICLTCLICLRQHRLFLIYRAKSIDGVGGLGTSVGLPSLIPDDKDENDFMKIAMITFMWIWIWMIKFEIECGGGTA